MKPGGGRLKGAQFERQIAGILHDLMGVTFRRDLEQYRTAERGDLIADDEDFPFVIECKRYGSGSTAKASWWDQACIAAKAQAKWPALVYRFDRCDTRVRVPLETLLTKHAGSGAWIEMPIETFAILASELMGES